MVCWLLNFFIIYLSLIHVQTLHKTYVNHFVIHSNMWGDLYLFLFWFLENIPPGGIYKKPASCYNQGLLQGDTMGSPFMTTRMSFNSCMLPGCHIFLCFLLCSAKHPDSEGQLDFDLNVEHEENHNQNWKFKHFCGYRYRWAGPLQGLTRLHGRCGQGWRAWVLF